MEPKVPPTGHCSSVMDQWWGGKEGRAWPKVQKLSLTVIGDGCLAMEYSHPAEKKKNQLFVITNIQKAKNEMTTSQGCWRDEADTGEEFERQDLEGHSRC